MRWKQFFTPVASIDSQEARSLIASKTPETLTLLDVRQPGEYEDGHLPGARLIPLPELNQRLSDLDPRQPTLIYCAVGGRSRVAAQILSAKGFETVYNLAGGFKAWQGKAAYGAEESGLSLFTGDESLEQILGTAYSLESGLEDFYRSMADQAANAEAAQLFRKLAEIETRHQDRILEAYRTLTGKTADRNSFENAVVGPVVEGGMTTEQYVAMFRPDLQSPVEIVDVAMSIEAQALDLYQRAAGRLPAGSAKTVLQQIANEEQAHLEQLGALIDRIAASK
ncbi:MAG TPA: rhodanese-like domain-containing protein [Desulfobacterales bacterium]